MDAETKPATLVISFTYTQQTKKMVGAMAKVLRGRDIDVTVAAIELTDPRYAASFQQFRMPKPYREVIGMVPAELRRKPAQIDIPDVITARAYDLVCLGAPTWWLSTETSQSARSGRSETALAITRTNPAFLGRFFRAADDGGGPGNRQGGKRRPT